MCRCVSGLLQCSGPNGLLSMLEETVWFKMSLLSGAINKDTNVLGSVCFLSHF